MSNSFLVRSVPKYSKHKASGRAYARFNGRCIYFGRYGAASSREAFSRLKAEWIQDGGRLPTALHEATVTEVVVAYKHETMPRIIVWHQPEGDVIVDGNNQYALRLKNGLAIEYVAKDFLNREAALLFAACCELGRRNLSESQRAQIVANLPRLSVGNPGANDANLHNCCVDELARLAGVSPRTVKSATKVHDKAVPEIVEGVREGRFKVSDTARAASLPKPIQERLAAKAMLNGTTLLKAAQPSGGISFDPEELDLAIAVAATKPNKNGQSVVDGKECQVALETVSKLVRSLKKLGLYDKHHKQLSEMIRDVRNLGGLTPLPTRDSSNAR